MRIDTLNLSLFVAGPERPEAELRIRKIGKVFGLSNLKNFRQFYLSYSHIQKSQTLSGFFKLSQKGPTLSAQFKASQKAQTLSAKSVKLLTIKDFSDIQAKLPEIFPLPWTAYLRLLSVEDKNARKFYEEEAPRGGWSVRQLDRQIQSQFYTRTMLSKNKMAMLTKGAKAKQED